MNVDDIKGSNLRNQGSYHSESDSDTSLVNEDSKVQRINESKSKSAMIRKKSTIQMKSKKKSNYETLKSKNEQIPKEK